jgi:hypothetical protein
MNECPAMTEQVADCAAPARDRHALQDLGNQDEQRDDERGEELRDGRRRHDGDGHRELHGHPPRQ